MRSLLSQLYSSIAADNFRNLAHFTYAVAAFLVLLALLYRLRDEFSKTYEAGADWAEFKAAKRRARRNRHRRTLRKYQPPPARASHLRAVASNEPNALEALACNATAARSDEQTTSHLRLVKPR